jgi:hypothetical protein
MAITININEITNQDYDGNDETVKEVTVEIDGTLIKESYSYSNTIENAIIESEVQDDLTTKGYTW